jgi:hypothetical protein
MKILKILSILIILVQTMVQTTFATTEQQFSFNIKAANTDSVFQKIISFAEEKGGYFTFFNGHSISLRFPATALDEFSAMLGGIAEIEGKSFNSTDKSLEVERLDSQIQSRKKLLGTYFELVKNAPFAELQSVEREMVSLNAQIERLQGQKQGIEKRAALASVSITAHGLVPLREREGFDTASPFNWISSTNLHSLQRDF